MTAGQELIEQGRQQGIEQGRQQGIEQGRQQGIEQAHQQGIEQAHQRFQKLLLRLLLLRLLRQCFGDLVGPQVEQRIVTASVEQIETWSVRVLLASRLAEVFAD